ncbi:MAG: hypothetical protein HY914_00010 [Desulfomonile tiedjei]|nr:hypothetical protein [Desulfomonile tiedjei]
MLARQAHCLEGALFACAALIHNGRTAGLLDLRTEAGLAHDHVVATFRENGCFGAVGKSNYSTLRYRSPVYRTPRELAMSFFDFYHNIYGDLVLRSYSHTPAPSERAFPGWRTREDDLDDISRGLDAARHFPVIDRRQARRLRLADARLIASGFLGADPSGIYIPARTRRFTR